MYDTSPFDQLIDNINANKETIGSVTINVQTGEGLAPVLETSFSNNGANISNYMRSRLDPDISIRQGSVGPSKTKAVDNASVSFRLNEKLYDIIQIGFTNNYVFKHIV